MSGTEPNPRGEPPATTSNPQPLAKKGSTLQLILVLLGVGAFGFVALVGGLVYWAANHGQEFVENSEQVRQRGESYALEHDAGECLAEGIHITEDCSRFDFSCLSDGQFFLNSCLGKAEGVEALCEDSPSALEMIDGLTYQTDVCKAHDAKNGQVCAQMVQSLQMYCDTWRTEKLPGDTTESDDP